MNKAIFLDRDGTINVEVDYLHEVDKLRFIDGVPEALALLKKNGYKLIVISNQSGIGRKYFKKSDVDKLHRYINSLLEEKRAGIDAFYYCPHLESDNCNCRKPKTGLFELAIREWNIDVRESYMVGDKETDIIAAHNLGCGYGLVLSGHSVPEFVKERYKECVYKNLYDFAIRLAEGKYGIER